MLKNLDTEKDERGQEEKELLIKLQEAEKSVKNESAWMSIADIKTILKVE